MRLCDLKRVEDDNFRSCLISSSGSQNGVGEIRIGEGQKYALR